MLSEQLSTIPADLDGALAALDGIGAVNRLDPYSDLVNVGRSDLQDTLDLLVNNFNSLVQLTIVGLGNAGGGATTPVTPVTPGNAVCYGDATGLVLEDSNKLCDDLVTHGGTATGSGIPVFVTDDTIATTNVTITGDRLQNADGYGLQNNTTSPFTAGERGLWVNNSFGTALLAYASGGLEWAVPFVSLSGISDGDVAAWDTGSSSWVLQAGGGGLPVGTDYAYLMYLSGAWGSQQSLAIRHTAALAGSNFSIRQSGDQYGAGYVSNEANVNASQFINAFEVTTPNHLSSFVVSGGGGPRLNWTSFGGTMCGSIVGRRTGATVGDLLMRGGGANFYCFSLRTNYSTQSFACCDSGILGIADIGNTNDRFVAGVGSGSGFTGAPNVITRMYTKDGSLYWRDALNVVCKLCGGAPETTTTLQTADDGTGASGATLDVENNVVVVGVPASGNTPITIPTPFVPGQVNDINVQVSVALGAGGGLTGFQVGDNLGDPDRFGIATTITLNTRVYRQDWTVVNERLYGFYITLTESGAVSIVITPVGGDWAGGQIIVTLFVHNTTAINY
ncbi:MAG: hypothetical protein JSV86_04865 [Gemmatimonadota bacterium]|nr:MAG: hypothetical protein JSV86_04865 [Gemmatimonadota bacterium]